MTGRWQGDDRDMAGIWRGYDRNRNLSSLEVAWLAGHPLLGFHLHTRCISHDVEDINYIDNITVDDGRYLICCWLFTMMHILTTLLLMMDVGHWQDLPELGWTEVLAQSKCKLPPWRCSVEYLNMHQDLNQRWANSVLGTEYEYKYYSCS